jgi:LPXTG-motif cell wall-anchored protein
VLHIRLAFASSAVLVLLGLTAAPSFGAQAAARHGVAEINGSSVPIGSTGKPFTVLTSVCCTTADQPVAYTGALTVTVDAAGAAGVLATTVTGPGCGTSGTVTTCRVPMTAGVIVDDSITLIAAVAPGAEIGDEATYALKVAGAGLTAWSGLSRPIGVSGHGPDLRTRDITAGTVRPGGHASFRPVITNVGDRPTTWVEFSLDDTLEFGPQGDLGFVDLDTHYGNCYYWLSGDSADCYFPLVIQPGQTVRVTAPIGLTLHRDAPDRAVSGAGYYAISVEGPGESWGRQLGDGPDLAFEPVAAPAAAADSNDTDVPNDGGKFRFRTGPNPADLSVKAIADSGWRGDPTLWSFTATTINNGPAFVYAWAGREAADPDAKTTPAVTVTFPAGTTVTEIDNSSRKNSAWCAPVVNGRALWPVSIKKQGKLQGRTYRCVSRPDLPAAGQFWPQFVLRVPAGTTGKATAVLSTLPNDPKKANNTATITIGAGGSGDGDNGGGGGGGLPITGAPVAWIAGAGGGALVLGLALVLGARRRRDRTIS